MSSRSVLTVGAIGFLAYLYLQREGDQSLLSLLGNSMEKPASQQEVTETLETESILQGGTGSDESGGFGPSTDKPKPPPPRGGGGGGGGGNFFTNPILLTVQDIAKDIIDGVVLSKLASALINDTGQRKMLAQIRAEKALKAKQDASRLKLAQLETRRAEFQAAKNNYEAKKLNDRIIKEQSKYDKAAIKVEQLNEKKAAIGAAKRAEASAEIQKAYNADVTKARQESTTKAKVVVQGNSLKATLAVVKQRFQNKFAKAMNNVRARIGKATAALRVPKFTTRGAVHSSASMFGFLVMAYDLVRMFEPKADIWANNRKNAGNPPPTEPVPVTNQEDIEQYNLPFCHTVVENGTATPTNPVLCRTNMPKPWEGGSSNGLMYPQECPPGFHTMKWGPFTRCTVSQYDNGLHYDTDNRPQQTNGDSTKIGISLPAFSTIIRNNTRGHTDINTNNLVQRGDVLLQGNGPNPYDTIPESFYVNLGLRAFVNELNLQMTTKAYQTPVGGKLPPPTWSAEVAYSIDTPLEPFDVKRYMREGVIAGKTILPEKKYEPTGALDDPDWPYQQVKNANDWGNGSGIRVMNAKYLGDFGTPYSEIGISIRGGEAMTEANRMLKLFPDLTYDEIESAISNTNASDVATTTAPVAPVKPVTSVMPQPMKDQKKCMDDAELFGISYEAAGCYN